MKRALIFFILFFAVLAARAQDIENILKSKPLELEGGSMNLSTVLYSSFASPSQRDFFSFYATGNLNVKLFGLAAPLSFNYTNRKVNYSQPFNNLSFAPRYKWIATRFGGQNVNYSPYTMAGHNLNGASVELTPGAWSIKMSYGRLNKVILPDTLNNDYAVTSFKRIGKAMALEYHWGGNRVYGTLFHGKDDVSSIPTIYYDADITPQENTAASLGLVKQLFGKFTLTSELATSLLTRDITTAEQREISKQQYYAYKSAVDYTGRGYRISAGYEKVDPGYLTLGGYYFNNDLERITLGTTAALYSGRVNINTQIGRERNNLRNNETNTTERWVGSINSTIQVSPTFTLSANYSNFSAYTNIRPVVDQYYRDELDTLNFYQVNQTASATANWRLGSKERPKTLAISTSLQKNRFFRVW